MALILSVTPAGRAALRNAKGDGTNAVRIDKASVTATPFVSGRPVPNEIKRLSTIAGGATAADTIHVTITDASSDVYSVFGFGFYLADGTLFASYGQAGEIMQKSAQSIMQLAIDVQFEDVAASSITFGDTNFNNPAATTDTPGVVELATDPETVLGTDRQRAITPGALKALLDSRFGVGAPSDYIKSLLTAATVVVLWQQLGLKSAAGYDTGAGKGLDADKLDGQDGSYYLDYNHLQNVPPPVEQSHSADDITSGTLAIARGGTGANTLASGGYLVGNGTNAVQTKTAAAVLADIGAAAKVHTHPMADIIGLANALAALAPLSSPALTGIPTAPTAASGTNSTQVATTAFVQSVIAALVNNSPAALDTLKELADALGDDPNFATTMTNLIGTKVNKTGDTMTGQLTMLPTTPGVAGVIVLDRPTPTASLALWGKTNGVNRWVVVPGGGGTENGNNAGSNFFINRYNDAGAMIDSPLIINRATGQTLLNNGLAVLGTTSVTTSGQSTSLSVTDTGVNGANIRLVGNGSVTPSKTIRVNGGQLQFLNDSYSAAISTLSDTGAWTTYFNGNPNGSSTFAYNASGSYGGGYHLKDGGFDIGLYSTNGDLQIAFGTNGGPLSPNVSISRAGAITAVGGFQLSDRDIKTNINPRMVQRGLAHKLAKMFCEWDRISDGVRDVGLIAQRVRRIAGHYVTRGPKRGRRRGLLAIDKAGLALEGVMDNALHLAEHHKALAVLTKRVEKLEKRK